MSDPRSKEYKMNNPLENGKYHEAGSGLHNRWPGSGGSGQQTLTGPPASAW